MQNKRTLRIALLMLSCLSISTGTRAQQLQSHGATVQDYPDSLRLYYKALTYDQIDPRKARDTMMAYCEQHPFATHEWGEWRQGIGYVMAFSNDLRLQLTDLTPSESKEYWEEIFD